MDPKSYIERGLSSQFVWENKFDCYHVHLYLSIMCSLYLSCISLSISLSLSLSLMYFSLQPSNFHVLIYLYFTLLSFYLSIYHILLSLSLDFRHLKFSQNSSPLFWTNNISFFALMNVIFLFEFQIFLIILSWIIYLLFASRVLTKIRKNKRMKTHE